MKDSGCWDLRLMVDAHMGTLTITVQNTEMGCWGTMYNKITITEDYSNVLVR